MTRLTAAPIILALLTAPASAATMDISSLEGFTRFGGSGIFGNGLVWTSPKYFFDPGTTIDFGTATILGDPVDGRVCGQPGAGGGGLCYADLPAYQVYYLTNGEGGPRAELGELPHGGCTASLSSPFCAPLIVHLLLTLGPTNDGIQLAFQGFSLHIDPPAQVPLPPAWLLFLGGLALTLRRSV